MTIKALVAAALPIVALAMAPGAVAGVRRAALVHDLGRVAVPARIWQKPGPLSTDEREQVRLHPYHGERILGRAPCLAGLAAVAGAHHERLDGSGYPKGLKGDEICLNARIVMIADVVDAITSDRPYRPRREVEDAIKILKIEGKKFSQELVAVLERILFY